MAQTIVGDEEKRAVRQAYAERRPIRVPVTLFTNPRVVLLNPEWNTGGWTFEAAAKDPETHVRVSLQHQLYRRRVLHRYCDDPTELPEVWTVNLVVYNVYEAAILGAPLHWYKDQVPDTEPWLTEDNREAVFDIDIENPRDNPFISYWLSFWNEMKKVCEGMTFEGRPVKLAPWSLCGTDGPVTVAMNLRGSEFMEDLLLEPEYADRLMAFITRAAIIRRKFFREFWGDRMEDPGNGQADDSCAMLSPQTYIERVMPHHRAYYETSPSSAERQMHMCGDATRLFPILHEQLNVTCFDTGFPVDHGQLRQDLGEDVQILGGPPVAAFLNEPPEAVYERARQILTSGVKAGGRFVLREGNNLPPNVPEASLEAMYQACLDYGGY